MKIGYEKRTEALAPQKVYLKRLFWNLALSLILLAACLLLGTIGYKYLAPCEWIDALHNASMILSGMGPVIEIKTTSGKLFSSFYALFSGVVFITNIGIILAPAIHRLFHALHVDETP
ncbi:MAG: hypothetical protein ACO3AW_06955 [Chitinophagaceae bacterium]|jgi:hypothetical protein